MYAKDVLCESTTGRPPKELTWRAKEPLELVHSNICDPMKIQTLGGNRYFLTFINDYSWMC